MYLSGVNKNNKNTLQKCKLSPMSTKVKKIGITKDKISSRGGITLFQKYVCRYFVVYKFKRLCS